jgi:LL-diaminopimelate aminotransferase
LELRRSFAAWYKKRFGVVLDPELEVLPLLGSKEGIGHIPLAFINEGDIGLIPDPGYPVYRAGVTFAGGKCFSMPLLPANDFLPDLSAIPEAIAKKAKIMFLNYPNNPTSAIASRDFFSDVLNFARKFDIIVCHDAAYSEICYDGYVAPSFLEVDGAKEIGVEFHSLSKTYNMTGWRIGFVVGNSRIISGLAKLKTNLDSGIFQAIQRAGIEALNGSQKEHKKTVRTYQERRDIFVNELSRIGWDIPKPKATFYIWAPVLPGYSSMRLVLSLLERAGVVTTPGVGFGENGEGFIRMSLTIDKGKLEEAAERISMWMRSR